MDVLSTLMKWKQGHLYLKKKKPTTAHISNSTYQELPFYLFPNSCSSFFGLTLTQ